MTRAAAPPGTTWLEASRWPRLLIRVSHLGDPSAPVLASHVDSSGWVGLQNATH
jgi:hypothetical protein